MGKITSCAERFVSNNFYMICTHQAHSKKNGGPRIYEFLLNIVFWRQMVGYRMCLMCVRTKNMRQVWFRIILIIHSNIIPLEHPHEILCNDKKRHFDPKFLLSHVKISFFRLYRSGAVKNTKALRKIYLYHYSEYFCKFFFWKNEKKKFFWLGGAPDPKFIRTRTPPFF